jgi:UPF0755 protein
MRKVKVFLLWLVLISAIVLGSLFFVGRLETPPGQGITNVFNLQRGWGARTVAMALEDSSLVNSRWLVLFHYGRDFRGAPLQAGQYSLSDTMEINTILSKFVTGDVIPIPTSWVTLPPGLRMEQSLVVISESLNIPIEELEELSRDSAFLESAGVPCLEGFLFPETYEFADSMSARSVISRIIGTGFEVMDENWKARCDSVGLSLFEAVILASIVEREAASDTDRNLVAGVFINRLRIDMRLESCATVQYALGEVHEILLFSDLEILSPYNTYRNQGLPPGPVCSPGVASLEAVASPDTTDGYLFFVSRGDGSGEHLFAVTSAGHAQNIRLVREAAY